MKAMAGAGILALPSTATAMGLGWGALGWCFCLPVSGYTMLLVAKSKTAADGLPGDVAHTLSELTLKITGGQRAARLVECLVCILQMAFAVGYVVVILSLSEELLPSCVRRWMVVVVLLPATVSMALIKDLKDLTWVSLFGIAVLVGVDPRVIVSRLHQLLLSRLGFTQLPLIYLLGTRDHLSSRSRRGGAFFDVFDRSKLTWK